MDINEKNLIDEYIKAYKVYIDKDPKHDGYEYALMQAAAINLCTKNIFSYHITFKKLYEECLKKKKNK